MSQVSSSTSSSSSIGKTLSRAFKDSYPAVAWMILGLLILDIMVNAIFPATGYPEGKSLSSIHRYFNYGLSSVTKLKTLVGSDYENPSDLSGIGWLNPRDENYEKGEVGKPVLVAYGQSFTVHVVRELEKEHPDAFDIKFAAGPAAPLNHSYAAFLDDIERGAIPDVAVLGVLASSFSALGSMTHMTWNFEAPFPYAYPKFHVENGELIKTDPEIASIDDFVGALKDEEKLNAWFDQLKKHDAFYSASQVKTSVLESSVIYRMIQRAFAQKFNQEKKDEFYNPKIGFNENTGIVETARKIIQDFSDKCSEHGCQPVVMLFNDRGFNDHLYAQLKESLETSGVKYLSTHEIAPATDVSNFIPDGHFTPEIDIMIGRELYSLVK